MSGATWLLLLLLQLVVACSKSGTTESRPSETPVPPVRTTVADAATSAQAGAARPDARESFGRDNAALHQV
jgi:hypothetical protein